MASIVPNTIVFVISVASVGLRDMAPNLWYAHSVELRVVWRLPCGFLFVRVALVTLIAFIAQLLTLIYRLPLIMSTPKY